VDGWLILLAADHFTNNGSVLDRLNCRPMCRFYAPPGIMSVRCHKKCYW